MTQGSTTINGHFDAAQYKRYQLHEKIGEGGMGVVYRATDRLTGETVALKQVHLSENLQVHDSLVPGATEDDLRLALAHEFQILAGLRHPHIISVLDYGFDEAKRPFFTMTHLPDAQNILDAAQEAPFEHKIELIQQLLQALAYLHRHGVLHRDLKPDNILIVNGDMRVLDFGLSVSEQISSNSIGTPLYLAPEVIEGGDYSPTADLYAVGVVLYQLLTGKHPFAPFDFKFLDRVLEEPPGLQRVEERIRPFLTQLLAKTADKRFSTATDTLKALAETLNQPPPPETSEIRDSYLQAATFVGRDAELARLTTALATAAHGTGSGWLIGGESGVGKSRLINELRTRALVDGFIVLTGQGVSDAVAPYLMWQAPLRQLLVSTPDVDDLTAAVLQPLVPDVARLLGRDVPPAPPLTGDAAQRRLITACTRLFRQHPQPILLLLEDLQWGTENLQLLTPLLRDIAAQSLMVVASYRADERPSLPAELPQMHMLTLERLSAAETAALARSMLGDVGARSTLVDFLQNETEGNTFFMVEVVRTLAEEAGRLQAIDPDRLPAQIFPKGVKNILSRRLQHVPEAAMPLLQLAAVAGRELSPPVLAQLAAVAGWQRSLDMWLQICAETAVVEVIDNRWRFSHDKLREALLHIVPEPELRQQHRHVAVAKEAIFAEDDSHAAELAFHWQKAADANKERQFARRAGAYALQTNVHDDAVHYLSRALALCPEDDWQQQYDVLWLREEAYGLMGSRAHQAADLTRLAHLADRLASPQLQAKTALRQSAYDEKVADYTAALQSAVRAADIARAADLPTLALEGDMALAWVYSRQGKLKEARDIYEASAPAFHELEMWDSLIYALIGLGITAQLSGDYETAMSHYEAAAAVSKQHNLVHRHSLSLNNMGLVLIYLGAYEQAKSLQQQALNILRDVGDWLGQIYPLNNLALLHMAHDECVPAQALAEEALNISLEVNDRYGEGRTCWTLGHVHFHCEAYGQAATYWQRALAIHKQLGQRHHMVEAQAGLLQAAQAMADRPQAEALLPDVLSLLDEDPLVRGASRPFWVYLACIEVLRWLDDARAERLVVQAYDLLRRRADSLRDPQLHASFLEADAANRRLVQLHEQIAPPE